MNGIINVNKPAGMTSADVVYRLRRLLGKKKIGHMGTLDPQARGVLPVGVGQAARLTEYYSELDKTYRAELTLGVATDTQDATGQVLTQQRADVSREELERVLPDFCGDLMQVPPMFSALHYQGRRLYEWARDGVAVEREPRPVRIDGLRLLEWREGERLEAVLEVDCSKGTYIRTLCHDIGAALGCGGHMSQLWRSRVGCWKLEDSWTLEDIEEAARQGKNDFLQALGRGLRLPVVELAVPRRRAFANGLVSEGSAVRWTDDREPRKDETVQVRCGGVFVGIGRWEEGRLNPVKVMVEDVAGRSGRF